MNKNGRLSALTNVLVNKISLTGLPRGRLVVDFCESTDSPQQYFDNLKRDQYNLFNLLLVDIKKSECFVFNNSDSQLSDLTDGKCHVMSNAPMVDSEWLKVDGI